MRANDLIYRLKELWGTKPHPPNHQAEVPAMPVNRNVAEAARRLEKLISGLESRGKSDVVGGCVQAFGLEKYIERAGSNHKDVATQIEAIATETLDRLLGPEDIFQTVGEGAFQICFVTTDLEHAQKQVARISAAIEERVDREFSGAGKVCVEGFAAAVPSARLRDAKDPMSALYTSLLEIRDAVNTRTSQRHSIPALRYAGALFQPLWSNRDFGQTSNRCVLDTLSGGAAARHLESIENLEDLVQALANVDCVLFAKSVEGLHYALGEVKRASIVVPVHFQTLATRQAEFLDLAKTLPLQYRKFVLLDIIGVPTATSPIELVDALRTACAIADRLILQLSPSDYRFNTLVKKLVWGASASVSEVDCGDPQVFKELAKFAVLAAEDGLFSFAYGANTISKAEALVSAGFDYLCGTAVHSTVPTPKPHARFKPLFGDPAPRSVGLEGKAGLRTHARFAPINPNSTITFPNGVRFECRVPNVSASGAVALTRAPAAVGDYLALGSIPAQVVRRTKNGFAVRFLEVQQASIVEIALQTPAADKKLLQSLRILQA